jgi:O-antigen/teichoic acid export membrane protein
VANRREGGVMTRPRLTAITSRLRGPVTSNMGARIGALASLTGASVLVARIGGPAGVGVFVLLRVLPWLTGMILSCGIYGASPYFLGGESRLEPRFRTTIATIAVVSGGIGVGVWVLLSPLVRHFFFSNLSLPLVALAGITVLTQVLESTGKACSQGLPDLPGANRVIVLEEFVFVPAFWLFHALGISVYLAIVLALATGDVVTLSSTWVRLTRKGFFHEVGRPTVPLVKRVLSFGVRAQLSSIILLLNARLDFIIVGAIVSPTALGLYAIASRFAELLRLPSLSINYVLYPTFAHESEREAVVTARGWIRRVGWVPAAMVLPLAIGARWLLPWIYGTEFSAAVKPTFVLLLGLAGSGVWGIISAFLYGVGRPGLNSIALGCGLIMTVILDITLIPTFGIMGAATASTVAYLTTTAVLVLFFRRIARGRTDSARTDTPEPMTDNDPRRGTRHAVDSSRRRDTETLLEVEG